MLRLASEGKPIRVVNDQQCTPSYTVGLGRGDRLAVRDGATGIFHVTNEGSCTWHEFAGELFRLAGLKPDLTSITSSDSLAVRRPDIASFR